MLQKTIALGYQLSKKEMRNIKGAMAPPNGGGTCQVQLSKEYSNVVVTGLSKDAASSLSTAIHWCCDSCCTASWSDKSSCSQSSTSV